MPSGPRALERQPLACRCARSHGWPRLAVFCRDSAGDECNECKSPGPAGHPAPVHCQDTPTQSHLARVAVMRRLPQDVHHGRHVGGNQLRHQVLLDERVGSVLLRGPAQAA